ncbi:ROK family protein [Bacillus sp. 1NLA3E]|uniref:ROK family protein n=1 Tax=Bacillus sp. 1NLA3E TaxID=666686 RepID=UPI000247E43F|nr:ROK family protein [Bacillus sp. 1NLA3E]AGK54352.1 NagC/XylR family transcriptional regulator [Bacillus sp. 1NLA3E]
MKKYIAFDVGGTEVKHGLLLGNGTILSKDSYDTQCNNLAIFLNDMEKTIKMYTRTHQVLGVAISLPGSINPYTGFSERSGSITALSNKNLKQLLEQRISLQVEIENDVKVLEVANLVL